MDVKKDSSSWIKTQDRAFRNFHWQDGYGGFSVGVAALWRLLHFQVAVTANWFEFLASLAFLGALAVSLFD